MHKLVKLLNDFDNRGTSFPPRQLFRNDQFQRFLTKLFSITYPWGTFHSVTPPLYIIPTLMHVFSIHLSEIQIILELLCDINPQA